MDEFKIRELVEQGYGARKIGLEMGCSRSTISRFLNKLGIKTKPKRESLSEESKKKISTGRKQWLKNNPDKHPWRNSDKFKSEPCEKVKGFLRDLNIKFIGEFPCGLEDYNFSIDIALPEKMIALEINGNQHYERTGELKPYYQKRHDLLVGAGWNVFEIHYSACFSLEKWTNFIEEIKNSKVVKEFDYFNYTPREPKTKLTLCAKCNREGNHKYSICKKCMTKEEKREHYVKLPSKFNWPEDEEFIRLVWSKPVIQVAKDLNISGEMIGKYARVNGIKVPPRGFWRSVEVGKTPHPNGIPVLFNQ